MKKKEPLNSLIASEFAFNKWWVPEEQARFSLLFLAIWIYLPIVIYNYREYYP